MIVWYSDGYFFANDSSTLIHFSGILILLFWRSAILQTAILLSSLIDPAITSFQKEIPVIVGYSLSHTSLHSVHIILPSIVFVVSCIANKDDHAILADAIAVLFPHTPQWSLIV